MEVVNKPMKTIILNPDDFIAQYLQGESVLSISNRLGVSRMVINKNLTKNNIKLRTQSQATSLVWNKMAPDQRKQQIEAAHRAALGRILGFDELCKTAKSCERNGCSISNLEVEFAKLMEESGISFSQQIAIGPYNCDFTIGPIVMEIFGGNWHWYGNHIKGIEKRFRYILYEGWHILVITNYGSVPIGKDSLSYMVAFIDFVSRNPSMTREYRVIRGAGDLLACGSMYDDKISIIPSFTTGHDAKGRYIRVPRKTPTM